jgi:hypothetical protein
MAGWVSSLNPSKHKSPDGVVRKLLLALLVRNCEVDKRHWVLFTALAMLCAGNALHKLQFTSGG